MERVNMNQYLYLRGANGDDIRFQKDDFVEIKLKHSAMYEKDPQGGYDRPVYAVKGRIMGWNEKTLELDVSHEYLKELITFQFATIESIKITNDKSRIGYYA